MKTVHEYRRHAEECDALAVKATSPEQRRMIADMAETWRMLATQREDKLRKDAEQRRLAEIRARVAALKKKGR